MALGPTQLPIGRGSFLLSWHVGLNPTEIPSPGQGVTPQGSRLLGSGRQLPPN